MRQHENGQRSQSQKATSQKGAHKGGNSEKKKWQNLENKRKQQKGLAAKGKGVPKRVGEIAKGDRPGAKAGEESKR